MKANNETGMAESGMRRVSGEPAGVKTQNDQIFKDFANRDTITAKIGKM